MHGGLREQPRGWRAREENPRGRAGFAIVLAGLYLACWAFFGVDVEVEPPRDSSRLALARGVDVVVGHAAFTAVGAWWGRTWVGIAVPGALVVSSFAVPVVFVVVVAVALNRSRRDLVGVLAMTLAAFVAHGLMFDPLTGSPLSRSDTAFNIASEVGAVALVAGAGWLWSTRQHQREVLAESRRADAVLRERTRIAREMHDSLAHRLTLVALHSGALARRPDLSPEARAASAQIVSDGVQAALDELRATVGSLRSTPTTELPQPADLASVEALVEDARASGQTVLLRRGRALSEDVATPAPWGRHIYRVVQEALTNARKHSPGQPVAVTIDGTPGNALHVRVTNPTRAASARERKQSGFGLVGMAERVSLLGGRLVTGHEGAQFVVDVVVPWPVHEEVT